MTDLYSALATGLPPEEVARTTRLVRDNERAQVQAVLRGDPASSHRDVPSTRAKRAAPPSTYQPVLLQR